MGKTFEVGAYCHTLKEIDISGVDRVILLNPHAIVPLPIKLSIGLDKKGLKTAEQWKGVVQEVTVMAHKGMALEKECKSLMERGFQVRVAIPSDIELLKSFDLGSLGVKLDLMAFDYARPISGHRTNFHTLLFAWDGPSVHQTVRFLHDQGVPLNQVNLGLTSFGVKFKNVPPGLSNTGYGEPCQGEQLESSIEIKEYLKTHPSAVKFYTSLQGCFQSFIYNRENGDWISYDDEQTIESKIEWARRQGLNGIFSYEGVAKLAL